MVRVPLITLACVFSTAAAPAVASGAAVQVVRDGGAATEVALAPGDTTVAALLGAADVRSFEFDFLDAVGDDGTLRIRRADAGDAVVSVADELVRVRAGGEEITVAGGELELRLGKGSLLTVTASADPRRAAVGAPVTFNAVAGGAQPGQRIGLSWTFADGERGSGAEVVHSFDTPGVYKVVVGATTRSDPAGTADIVVVRVAAPDPTLTPTATPTPTPTPSGIGGAGGGGGPGGAGAAGGTGGGGAGATGGADAGAATRIARANPHDSAEAGHRTAASREKDAALARPALTATPFGRLVTGEILGAAAPAPAARPGATSSPGGGGFHIPAGAVAGALVLIAACAGFALDMRRARPRWAS